VSDLLHVDGVSKTWDAAGFAPVHAVRAVSLRVAPGEYVAITGPSGSGKTTLLSLCAGLLRPDAGRVLLDGQDLASLPDTPGRALRLRAVGFVFQRGLLLRNLSARQNVALVARAAGRSWTAANAAADALLARLGLAARASAMPATLSAGECQRVALARALVLGPRLVLADEPTAHLDAAAGAQVTNELRTLARAQGAGLVVATHDARVAGLADRLLTLDDGALRGG
jgi:putative ABC transport system ATP-binding protein